MSVKFSQKKKVWNNRIVMPRKRKYKGVKDKNFLHLA